VLFGLLYALRNRSFPRWILWLGRISYSLYLVHGIVLSLLPADLNPVVFVASVIGLSVAISAVTYEFIEKPAIEFHRSRMRERRLHKDPSLATG
jgi:peptidoglycan/LPS O-acetylase OafA/YrhL